LTHLPDDLEQAMELHVDSVGTSIGAGLMTWNCRWQPGKRGWENLIKLHQKSSLERTWLVVQCVLGVHNYCGNLAAVPLAPQWGTRQVWIPMRSAPNDRLYMTSEVKSASSMSQASCCPWSRGSFARGAREATVS